MVRDKEDIVVVSTDMFVMCSSLDIDTVAAVAAKEFVNSDIDLILNVDELGLYLTLTRTAESWQTWASLMCVIPGPTPTVRSLASPLSRCSTGLTGPSPGLSSLPGPLP